MTTLDAGRRTAAMWLSGFVIVAGVTGGLVAGSAPFATQYGPGVLKLFTISRLGALVLLALGVLGALAARRGAPKPLAGVGTLFLVLAMSQIVGIIQPWNKLGGHASLGAICIGIGAGLIALAATPGSAPEPDE
jgi:hypothetical protein